MPVVPPFYSKFTNKKLRPKVLRQAKTILLILLFIEYQFIE